MEEQTLPLPKESKILHVHVQGGFGYIWVLCPVLPKEDNPKDMEERTIITVGTGENFNSEGLTYLGTYHQKDGDDFFVWHLFERVK